MDDEAAKRALTRFKGVGPKTAACVLMFCLGRTEFPVDVHVWRITKRLGWIPERATREQAYQHLNRRVPPEHKFSLHVLLVEHGKHCPRCCARGKAPRRKVLGPCPLTIDKGARCNAAEVDPDMVLWEECARLSPIKGSKGSATTKRTAGVKSDAESEHPAKLRLKRERELENQNHAKNEVKKERKVKQEVKKERKVKQEVKKERKVKQEVKKGRKVKQEVKKERKVKQEVKKERKVKQEVKKERKVKLEGTKKVSTKRETVRTGREMRVAKRCRR
jgi:adenine-specific DNA glycosylase